MVVFDPAAAWTVDPHDFHSKSRNTPFAGAELKGRVVHTFFRGQQVVADGAIEEMELV